MKLYKIDFNNQIGKNIVTVPTDSEFLLGLSNGDSAATIKLYDGATEITALEDKVGNYTCFRFSTNETPSRKVYKGTVNGSQPVEILVISKKMSVAYRDFEGSSSGATCKPLVLQNSSTNLSVDIDAMNFMDVERTIYEIGTTDAQVASKTITVNIDLADFPVETGSTQMFKLNLKINCLGDAVTTPDGLISIITTDGELSTSDFYASYISGPTSLTTVIGDSSGTSLLVELVFDADGGYAFIKGVSYID